MSNPAKIRLSQKEQVEFLGKGIEGVLNFKDKLRSLGRDEIKPLNPEILQLNLGYMCNQQCLHCHVDASPYRKEIMTRDVMYAALRLLDHSGIKTVDLTGGAPEMNPDFEWFVRELSGKNIEVIVRSNLTILMEGRFKTYPELFRDLKVTVISSLPCYTEENTDRQRGEGVFSKSITALRRLNDLGYGTDPDLKLHLVFNPGGPAVAPNQKALENDYKKELLDNFGIVFNSLYTITNLPVSRFLEDLIENDRYDSYMNNLEASFNPLSVDGVMCRNTISVDWQGNLFDCDFNQMLGLGVASGIKNIKEFQKETFNIRSVVLGNHCYGCTAGEGSSCQGAII